VKEYPDFVAARYGGAFIWLRRALAAPSMVELMSEADRLFDRPDCAIIKDQKKIKVARVPLEYDGRSLIVYIKRYNAFSLRYRLQSIFVCSGAERSLRAAAILSSAGVATALPIAAVEHRAAGMLRKSFYVSEEIPEGKTADAYWRKELMRLEGPTGFRRRRAFLDKLSELFARLHAHNVYHNDLKDANIVVASRTGDQNDPFRVLDLEGVRRVTRISRSRQLKNLVQLNRTFGRYLRRTELVYFLERYLTRRVIDRHSRKRWVEGVLRRSARLDRIKKAAQASWTGLG
jgi:hypothetical protein